MSPPDCAIVVPVYRPQLDPYTEISLRQCARIFPGYTIILTGPERLDLRAYRKILPESRWEPFPPAAFASIDSYSRLLLEAVFYRRFTRYEFMLIHQTDAFMFRDELGQWCASGDDYVGAPFPNPELTDLHLIESWTGRNGGLSLRRVSAFLDVLTTFRGQRRKSFRELQARYRSEYDRFSLQNLRSFYKQHMGYENTLGKIIDTYRLNEDVFWSLEAPGTRSFLIPGPLTSARFSVETEPRFWSEHLGGALPAGCHAWWKYDLEFWKPHIEECGYELPAEVPGQQNRSAA